MRQERLARVAAFAALGLGSLTASGCRRPGAEPILGPDGSRMMHVHCGANQAACFRMAGELCPQGYEMKPVLSGRDGNFLLRCRDARVVRSSECPAPPPAASPTHAQALLGTTPAASNDGWPPSSEPWPAAYPWPPPEATIGIHAAEPPPTSVEGGAVDLGY